MLKLDLNEKINGKFSYARQEDYQKAKKAVASYAKTSPGNIVITNGSFHAINVIFTFLLKEKDVLLLPVPTFTFYKPFEKNGKFKIKKLFYNENFNSEDIVRNLNKKIKAVYLANPNNPIGYIFSRKELIKIIRICKKHNVLAVFDEAYFEFSGTTVKDLVNEFSNLFVIRTFSKAFGMAGLRMGYIITAAKNAERLEEMKGPPYIVGRIGLSRLEGLKKKDFREAKRYANNINIAKKSLEKYFQGKNISFFPSKANFITFMVPNAQKLIRHFQKKKVLVRGLSDYPDGRKLLKNSVRLTVPPSKKVPSLKSIFSSGISEQSE